MLSTEGYVPLERAIASLRRESIEDLKALAGLVKSTDPRKELDRSAIISRRGGDSIPGFAITYGQLGEYLDTAVSRYASVFIDTEAGTVHAEQVAINRQWLAAQIGQASRQAEAVRETAIRSRATRGATVSPILPALTDQSLEVARAELRRVKIRVERHTEIGADDSRDAEIQRLKELLSAANDKADMALNENNALRKTIRILGIENDQLRQNRAPVTPVVPTSPATPEVVTRKPSNVEIYNAESRVNRKSVTDRAASLWLHEDYADHRTGDMVRTIRLLAETEPIGKLPKTDAVLARWISEDVAPPFAKRKGRPRLKNSPESERQHTTRL